MTGEQFSTAVSISSSKSLAARATMLLRIMRFSTLMLASLGMAFGAAHTLELIPKMNYDPELYTEVTSTLYRYYGTVGGPIQVLAILSSVTLSLMTRRSRGFWLTVTGTFCLIVSLGLWFVLVQPVNVEWGNVLQTGPRSAVVQSYLQLRERWEYGHMAAFIVWFFGVALLTLSVIADTPEDHRREEST
jgi:hypothetical protein